MPLRATSSSRTGIAGVGQARADAGPGAPRRQLNVAPQLCVPSENVGKFSPKHWSGVLPVTDPVQAGTAAPVNGSVIRPVTGQERDARVERHACLARAPRCRRPDRPPNSCRSSSSAAEIMAPLSRAPVVPPAASTRRSPPPRYPAVLPVTVELGAQACAEAPRASGAGIDHQRRPEPAAVAPADEGRCVARLALIVESCRLTTARRCRGRPSCRQCCPGPRTPEGARVRRSPPRSRRRIVASGRVAAHLGTGPFPRPSRVAFLPWPARVMSFVTVTFAAHDPETCRVSPAPAAAIALPTAGAPMPVPGGPCRYCPGSAPARKVPRSTQLPRTTRSAV